MVSKVVLDWGIKELYFYWWICKELYFLWYMWSFIVLKETNVVWLFSNAHIDFQCNMHLRNKTKDKI